MLGDGFWHCWIVPPPEPQLNTSISPLHSKPATANCVEARSKGCGLGKLCAASLIMICICITVRRRCPPTEDKTLKLIGKAKYERAIYPVCVLSCAIVQPEDVCNEPRFASPLFTPKPRHSIADSYGQGIEVFTFVDINLSSFRPFTGGHGPKCRPNGAASGVMGYLQSGSVLSVDLHNNGILISSL